ncbi:acetyl-CoA hydrolase/transferase family protein [Caulobacter sp. KR2-114]|uniref:acetyl-CoA hydrolase/transferase family protein n=1 Tax=Caulobacter sp. KR2-114 TaxID=3400912 RepID=UPI003C0BF57C
MLLEAFRPGRRIYVQGGAGEPLALRALLAAHPEALADVTLAGCFLPGMNDFDYAALNDRVQVSCFMLPPAFRGAFEAGRVTVTPMAYSQIAVAMRDGPAPDLAILQVTPPDADGNCSFGPCADFAPLVWPRASKVAAFINPRLPRARRGPTIPVAKIDIRIDADGPFITAVEAPPAADQQAIAARIAGLVPDGAAIQTGIGGAPAAAVGRLTDRRGLVVRSGMVTEGYRRLADAGALADAGHITGLVLGSPGFMAWGCETFELADATVTHGPASLAAIERLWALNSALEVDLFGQANVEWQGGRLISGLGGAPDFARAARRSPGGRGVLALPATARGGTISRIVPRIAAPTVSIPRDDTDLVITEHGVADLRGASLEGRAKALIAIAAPEHREGLERGWAELKRGL